MPGLELEALAFLGETGPHSGTRRVPEKPEPPPSPRGPTDALAPSARHSLGPRPSQPLPHKALQLRFDSRDELPFRLARAGHSPPFLTFPLALDPVSPCLIHLQLVSARLVLPLRLVSTHARAPVPLLAPSASPSASHPVPEGVRLEQPGGVVRRVAHGEGQERSGGSDDGGCLLLLWDWFEVSEGQLELPVWGVFGGGGGEGQGV